MGRGSENLPLARASRLARPAIMRRVPRLADYTGGRLSFGNERAAPLAFPPGGRSSPVRRRPLSGLSRLRRGELENVDVEPFGEKDVADGLDLRTMQFVGRLDFTEENGAVAHRGYVRPARSVAVGVAGEATSDATEPGAERMVKLLDQLAGNARVIFIDPGSVDRVEVSANLVRCCRADRGEDAIEMIGVDDELRLQKAGEARDISQEVASAPPVPCGRAAPAGLKGQRARRPCGAWLSRRRRGCCWVKRKRGRGAIVTAPASVTPFRRPPCPRSRHRRRHRLRDRPVRRARAGRTLRSAWARGANAQRVAPTR